MIKQENIYRFVVLCALIVLAAYTRALPRIAPQLFLWNFTAVGALCVFAGSKFENKFLAMAIPMAVMALSDLFLGNGFDLIVYASFLLMVVCGMVISKRTTITSIAIASITGAVLFFLITNLSYVYQNTWYPHSLQGVIASYVAGLPFLRNMIIGDAIYGIVLFGGLYLLEKKFPQLAPARVRR
ncbi:DUF6580 family putative transport protein [Hufsiella ginkgonis]|uniref:ECF transporter S component n=1 Tax=Hufsiella ginkgonis TaxID=2695274 RepID=A0A7K1XZ42_9SPHI|nr:DUF6580 family putative transport protein [Hufsiella ginkgonis]MXV16275.1 hypothetical protein [Hufsiella ginkgonis]